MQKVEEMERHKGLNHSLDQLRGWLAEDFGPSPFPHTIHVAGTNGKGSVITWLELLLAQKGLGTGAFISPHLVVHSERFRLNQKPISMDRWEELYDRYARTFKARDMTMFEMDLFMACALFQEVRPDFVLMETGLGGTRDATTALDYPWGIITSIGLDHMGLLGSTKTEIAQAKAGIIQEGMTLVTAEQDPACLRVFQDAAKTKHATLIEISRDFSPLDPLWNPALPAYQKENYLCARTLLEQAGFSFTPDEQKQAIDRFFWPARFQIVRSHPLLFVDGAHNANGIDALCKSLQEGGWSIDQIFFSVLADKQAREMIARLQTIAPDIHLVHFESQRLARLDTLAQKENLDVLSFDTLLERLKSTNKNTLVCGSLYFAGEVLQALHAAIDQAPSA